MRQTVLSLFPGIGLLDMAFEEEGFCVVRGPGARQVTTYPEDACAPGCPWFPTHDAAEYIIRIDYKHQGVRRLSDYVREGSGILTFHTLARAAQVAQVLNMYAKTTGVFHAIDANGPEVI
jgi:hypothetical protein